MDKRKFNDKTTLPLLTYGCMRFPETIAGKIYREKAIEMLDTAIANGINHFDTAYPYHNSESETFLGDYLQKYDRRTYFISSKSPVWLVETYEDFEKYLDEQLEKCKTTYFDFYLMHGLNKASFKKIKNLGFDKFIADAKAKGKIRNAGFSYHDKEENYEPILNAYHWDFTMIQLNYMDINHQQGMKGYELATKAGIPVFIMEPLKGSRLARINDTAKKMFADQNDDTPAKWAFRWAASLPNVRTILSGMASLENVKENIETFKNISPLTTEEMQVVANVRDYLNKIQTINCTACKYCMPCPHNIDIPKNLFLYNDAQAFNTKTENQKQYTAWDEKGISASYCVDCGKCSPKCPQQLDIPKLLRTVSEFF